MTRHDSAAQTVAFDPSRASRAIATKGNGSAEIARVINRPPRSLRRWI